MGRILLVMLGAVLITGRAYEPERNGEWPRRALIEAVYENSMMHRYLAKPVHESILLDDMETDRGWSMSGIGTLTYTTERAMSGKRSLRFRTSLRDEAHLKANQKNGTFIGEQGGITMARLNFSPPRDWSRFNRISIWVYVHPTSMRAQSFRLRFEWEGMTRSAVEPNPSHHVQDLVPGKWQQIVWEIPDLPRTRVTTFLISQALRGHEPEDEGVVTYDFDRLELQRVDPEPYEGWEVAPGRLAFSHAGYRPADEKLAVASRSGDTRFELVEASTGRTVADFPVKPVENQRGKFNVLDFTDFTQPGRYLLRCGKVAGRPFVISDDLWFGVIEKALNFYYGERCGFDVPGVHRVCHQDWRGVHAGETKLINGGWHDAGDLSQGSHRTSFSVYAMLRIYDQLRLRNLQPDLQARLIEEARWGLDWLLKTRFGEGYRITWALSRIYTDNRIGTLDDMVVPAEHVAFENFLFAAVASHAAQTLKDADPRRAARSLQAAEEDYRATLKRRPGWSNATRDEAALGALAATELYRATSKPTYAADAEKFGRLLLQCQQQRFVGGIPITGYFYSDTKRQRIVHDHHMSFEEAPLIALGTLCDTFPNHPDWMRWYGGALLHSEFFLGRGSAYVEPYRLIPNSVWPRKEIEAIANSPELRKREGWDGAAALAQYNMGTRLSDDYRLRVFPIWRDFSFHGNTAIQLSGTAALAEAAVLRNQAGAENLARRQLQWVFGGNPFSQSLMYGEGYDFQPHFAYCLRNLVGSLPVGIDSRRDDLPHWSATNTATYKEIWVVPVSRLLWSLAYAAVPAQVTGSAATGAVFREARTKKTVTLPAGKFSVNLAPGDYAISYGGATKRMRLMAGARYDLPLDARRAVDVTLSARRRGLAAVEIEAVVRGAGEHRIQFRAFNGVIETPETAVTLEAGRVTRITRILALEKADQAWAVVAIADGSMSGKTEIFGAPAGPGL